MKRKKQYDCVEKKNNIQDALYEKYKEMSDAQREKTIEQNLMSSNSPIAVFWQQNMLRVAEARTKYKRKDTR